MTYTFDDAVERIDSLADKGRLTQQAAIGIVRNTNKNDKDAVRDYINTLRTEGYPSSAHVNSERILGKRY
jgi:hypothetical protein